MICAPPQIAELEELFRHEVFKMLKAEGKINDTVIEKILRHLGLWKTCLRATHRQARNHDPPVRNASHIPKFTYLPVRDRTQTGDDDYSQVPSIDYWLQ